jgi:pimeloyl-ACP methyl ester carboxylesterase/protein-tyrosine phosphatase
LKKHSHLKSYTVPSTGFTYPGVRTFYRPHPQESKLPNKPNAIPLLVFVHGLGGSAAQFHPILISLVNLAPCLAIDLPGCGTSIFEPKAWEAYTTDALVRLLAVVINQHRDSAGNQNVVLIGHSMGCSLAALLASASSPYADLLEENVAGLIAICPQADPPSEHQTSQIKRVASIPGPLFDFIRKWDRRGGISSKSVKRMAGPDADEQTRKLQLRYNQQSQSKVWQRMALGMTPDYSTGSPRGGLPGEEVWKGLQIPVFLAAGEADTITPPHNVKRIVQFLGRDVAAITPPSNQAGVPIAAAPVDPAWIDTPLLEKKHHDSGIDSADLPKIQDDGTATFHTDVSSIGESMENIDAASSATGLQSDLVSTTSHPSPRPRRLVVKTTIIPKPAAHSLLFAPSSSRTLSGLISTFLDNHIDPRLSLGWQLQHLSAGGKWDVKNLEKWKAIKPVSLPIAGVFRAMKTLREVDEQHTPKKFVKEWAGKLKVVVDISHDTPVYDPKGLQDGGIAYQKFPTVSKQPPTVDEVKTFIALIDSLRASSSPQIGEKAQGLIGVHCHYGFNRTGFFLVSYLVERLGYGVEDAIEEFAEKRPKGIKHEHFIDMLHVRYCHGLRRAPTL